MRQIRETAPSSNIKSKVFVRNDVDTIESLTDSSDHPETFFNPPTKNPTLTPPNIIVNQQVDALQPQITPLQPNTLINFRTTNCGYFCNLLLNSPNSTESLKKLPRWSKNPELLLITHKRWTQFFNLPHTILNQIGKGSACIGGGKGKQLACHRSLAQNHGCDFESLEMQPVQYDINDPSECARFYADTKDNVWIVKPGGSYHGRGITIHEDKDKVRKKYGACPSVKKPGLIAQEYVSDMITIENHKFDLRTYLLIASTNPVIAFYHDGFIRKADKKVSTDYSDAGAHVTNDVSQKGSDHFWSFDMLQAYLNDTEVMTQLRSQAKRVSVYLTHTASESEGFVKKNGRFQLFALDWMMARKGAQSKPQFHLLEANGNPLLTHYEGIDLTPTIWTEMIELVRKIHVTPQSLDTISVAQNFEFGGWKLVFNELEAEGEYDACKLNEYADEKHPLFGFNP